MPCPGASTLSPPATTSRWKPGSAVSAENTRSRPPAAKVPVVWVRSPESRMAIGTLNMSTIVVVQNMPPGPKVNSTQSCRTW
jgi:hypothetical protein